MYQSKFIQLLAVISLTTVLSACGDKPKEKEQTQAPQEETQTSVKVNPEELNIAEYDANIETNNDVNINAKTADKPQAEDNLEEEINKLDTELQQISKEIESSTETSEVTANKPSADNVQTDEEELSDLEKEAMAMADDVN